MATKNFVIINCDYGSIRKSADPKHLIRLGDNKNILERQIKSIRTNNNNPKIYHTHQSNYALQSSIAPIKHVNDSHIDFDCEHGPYKMLIDTINKYNISSCYIILGNIVYDKRHFPKSCKLSTIYTQQNYLKKDVGINSNDGDVSHMMWGLQNTWSGISYFNTDFIDALQKHRDDKKYKKAYLFEMVNNAIDNGVQVKVEPLGSDVIVVNRNQDADIANAKFNIGKVSSKRK